MSMWGMFLWCLLFVLLGNFLYAGYWIIVYSMYFYLEPDAENTVNQFYSQDSHRIRVGERVPLPARLRR